MTPAPPPPATDPHEPKEPRRGPTREEGCVVCTQPTTGNALCNACWDSYKEGYAGSTLDAICWAASRARAILAAERDEWKLRAELEAVSAYDLLARAAKAEAERDAARAELADPRIAAWRALDAEQRSYRVEDLRTWADLVEAGAAPDGADHGPSPLRIAAAALEALGEKP